MNKVFTFIITLLVFITNINTANANLPPGSPAQDFTLTDINGQTYNLYSLLNAGKTVYIEFAATWCIFCWNYHNTNILQDFYNQYGPNGTNEVMVLFLEAELNNTHDCLYGASTCVGPKGGTKGDWVTGVPFPIFDLQQSDASIIANYQQVGFPTIYCICPQTKTAYEVGQATIPVLYSYVTSCQLDYQLVNKTNLLCKGDHSGSIDISTTSGVAPLSYLWSNGATTEDISGLNAGTYRLTVTDANGVRKVSSNIVITEPPPLLISTNQLVNEGCEGTHGGSININSTGGTLPYVYNWSDGAVSEDISSLSAGAYAVSLTDHNACFTTKNFVLSSYKNPSSDAGNDKTINCMTPTTVLQGDGDYTATYKWTTNNGHIVSGSSTLYPLVDKGGIYTLTVKYTSTGCTASDDVNVVQNTEHPYANIEKPEDINCKHKLISLDGTHSSTGSNITYAWYTTNGNIISGANTNSVAIQSPGNYTLILQNTLSFCWDTASVIVIKDTLIPNAKTSKSNELNCNIDTLFLNASQSSQGKDFLIHWTTQNGNIISGDSTINPKINKAGIYKLIVSNLHNGCTASSNDTIIQNSASFPQSIFNYTNALLSVSFHDFSTGIPESYFWDFGDGMFSSEMNPVHEYEKDGNYIVCFTTSNLCGSNTQCQNLTLTSNTNIPSISNIAINNVTCQGGSNGCIDLSVIYGTAPYSFYWSNGSQVEDPCELTAGTYSVTVTDAIGVSIIANNITVKAENYINIANTIINNPDCNTTNGSIWLNMSSNTNQLNYKWSQDSSLNSNEANNLAEGNYQVVITDVNGCSTSSSIDLIEKGEKLSTQSNSVYCFGNMTAFIDLTISGGSLPYNILWNTGDSTEDLKDKAAGTYSCIVTDATGCIKKTQVEIDQPTEILAVFQITNSENTLNNGSIIANSSGGVAPYSFSWSSGDSTQSINQLAPGVYILTITDKNGCQKVYTNTVEELTETSQIETSPLVFNIYPNPTTDVLNIFIKNSGNTKSVLSITDLLGNVVYILKSENKEINKSLDLTTLPSGYYMVKLIINNGTYIKKLGLARIK